MILELNKLGKESILSFIDEPKDETVLARLKEMLVDISNDDIEFGEKRYSMADLLGFITMVEMDGFVCPECGLVNNSYHCNCQKRGM